jgi:hypothetical protein
VINKDSTGLKAHKVEHAGAEGIPWSVPDPITIESEDTMMETLDMVSIQPFFEPEP